MEEAGNAGTALLNLLLLMFLDHRKTVINNNRKYEKLQSRQNSRTTQ